MNPEFSEQECWGEMKGSAIAAHGSPALSGIAEAAAIRGER